MSSGDDEPSDWLRALFNDSPMAIGFSRDGTMLDANPAYLAAFGYDRVDELRGRSLLEQIAPSHRSAIVENIARRARGSAPPPTTYQSRGLRKDGREFPFEVTTCRVAIGAGPLTIAFIRDISERERSQAELNAALEMFRTLSASALEGVYLHEAGRITMVNEAGAALLGATPEELIGRSVLDLCNPTTRPLAERAIREGSTAPFEIVGLRLDGRELPIEVHPRLLVHQGRPTRIAVIRDLTERKLAEEARAALDERVRRSEKLESLGALAGGVAHDFNNILTIITSEAALARRAGATGAIGESLRAIEHAADRAAELCRQMLAYGGRASLDRQRIDVSALVADTEEILEAAVARRAALRHDLAPGVPVIVGDPTQLRQVLLNLVINAVEAVAAPDAVIRIATGRHRLEADAVRAPTGGELSAGDYAWLEVSDPGHGMEAATVARMFDPFFSTKFNGRGLGMASVLGIVRGHGGAIEVISAPGQGTRIRVLVPAAAVDAEVDPAPEAAADDGQRAGMVLVVDDEPAIRRATRALLRGVGFEVLVAADGAAGVAAFDAHAGEIRAVLMDLAMPIMDGVTAAAAIRRRAPGVPILLLTGHAAAHPEALATSGADELLEKPYAPSQLLAVVRRLTA